MRTLPAIAGSVAILAAGLSVFAATAADRPNILIIVADDLGWGDVGFNGCREIPTPNLDAIARSGVVFSAGYASHPYCSPSRAGLLTGRYQQRFGHECNPGAIGEDLTAGLPLDEVLLSDVLGRAGYRTGAVGKWHLGDGPEFQPHQRGFDEWYGFSGGGLSYWGDLGNKPPVQGVVRNGTPVPKSELSHLTDDFSREAAAFIERNHEKAFFLYLAYNAPHAPDHATRAHLKLTEHIEYGGRAVYGAMVAGMDAGIGRVMKALDRHGMRDRTLVFFYSDNGGRGEHAVNFPYRGHKGMVFEGGIRVPFCVAWPDAIPGGRRYDTPMTALDIFPTALAAAGADVPAGLPLDGLNLLPFLGGKALLPPDRTLFWRYAMSRESFGYAVRHGEYKLVFRPPRGRVMLFDLAADPYEQTDLADREPERVKELTALYREWDQEMKAPGWLDPHGENVLKEDAALESARKAASRGEKGSR